MKFSSEQLCESNLPHIIQQEPLPTSITSLCCISWRDYRTIWLPALHSTHPEIADSFIRSICKLWIFVLLSILEGVMLPQPDSNTAVLVF